MSNKTTLPSNPDCEHVSVFEYWHENDLCGLDQCAVSECLECEMFVTECGMGTSAPDEMGECDTCKAPYELGSRVGRCGDCGDCGKCCEHAGNLYCFTCAYDPCECNQLD